MSVRRDFPDLPPVWMTGHALAAWAVARWAPVMGFASPTARAAGGLVAALGVGLAVWAAVHFARARTKIEPRERPTALIRSGPFAINRNPIYTGMALVLLGWAVWLGALGAALVAMAFPVVIDRRFVRGEEAALLDAFGAEARRYMSEVRRW